MLTTHRSCVSVRSIGGSGGAAGGEGGYHEDLRGSFRAVKEVLRKLKARENVQ